MQAHPRWKRIPHLGVGCWALDVGCSIQVSGGQGDRLWSYAPAVTSGDARQVDDLSLFLSMRDSPDERVQAALQEMMEDMPW